MLTIENKLDALRDTERGLVVHNCYVKMKQAHINLPLITIMVTLKIISEINRNYYNLSVAYLLLMK